MITRREVLQYAGIALNAPPLLQAAQSLLQSAAWLGIGQTAHRVTPPVRVVRALDLLVLDLDWRNLEYVPGGGGRAARLRRVSRAQPALLILRFPAQHVAEEGRRTAPLTVGHALAHPSRLAFRLPDALDEIEYRLPVLLDAMMRLGMHLNCRAPRPPICSAPVREPAPEETAIEVPYGLVLSPTGEQSWVHALGPRAGADGRVELWHTRLVPRPGSGPNALRAIHYTTRGFSESTLPQGRHRRDLAHLTSDTTAAGGSLLYQNPPVITADRLMLSALGAWMDARFVLPLPLERIDPQRKFALSAWRHHMVMGRDQFVQVVEEGFLIPFGHRAALVTTRERRFADRGNGALVAYLHEEQRIVVTDPVRTYFVDDGTATTIDRETLFRSVRIVTPATPAIDSPPGLGNLPPNQSPPDLQPFQVRVGQRNFEFQLSGVDRHGQVVDFSMPLVFATRNRMFAGMQLYSGNAAVPRQIHLGGRKVAYAPGSRPSAASSGQSDTSLETDLVTLGVTADTFSCRAVWYGAWVRLPAVKQFAGSGATSVVVLADVYRNEGFGGSNRQAQLYLQLVQSLPIGGGGLGGGLAQMQVYVNGLSRASGAVCGRPSPSGGGTSLDQFRRGVFDPAEYFPDARLLGSLRLPDILRRIDGFGPADAGGRVPKLAVQEILAAGVPTAVETSFQWRTSQLRPFPEVAPLFVPSRDGAPAELSITSLSRKELTGSQALTSRIEGELRNFEIKLVGNNPYLTIKFRSLRFRSLNGERPVVTPEIAGVEFGQALRFVDTLARSLGNSGEGMSLDLVRNGVRAGTTLALPTMSFGVLRLENISLSIGLYLPLVGEEPLSYSFAFGKRENPFQAAVWIFTGGGFFECEVSPAGLLRLEAGIEFGASLGLDLGVVSGKVEVMAGISYKMLTAASPAGRSIQLEGYLRASGALEVLAIITLSVTIYLGLTYDFVRGDIWGRARVTLEVRVLFFNESVSFEYEQRFAGSGPPAPPLGGRPASLPSASGPAFEEFISRDEWRRYCAAFG